jgi:two-component system phosphate regulon response regulator PhoB
MDGIEWCSQATLPKLPAMAAVSVLVIGETREVAADIVRRAGAANCHVAIVNEALEGIRVASRTCPDLVLIAESPGQTDSLDICRRIREAVPRDRAPVFLMTPKGLAGVNAGYSELAGSTKTLPGLVVAIVAALGTPAKGERGDRIRLGELVIDRHRHQVVIGDRELKMTPTEFRLLWTLARESGRVFTRQELTDTCIGENAPVLERTIDVHVKSIRQKLQPYSNVIETVRGVGYRILERVDAVPHVAKPRFAAHGRSQVS